MRIVDCHVHVAGEGRLVASDVLRQMDELGLERILLISRPERVSIQQTHANLLEVAEAIEEAPKRLSGLAWVNPLIPGIAPLAERALVEMEFSGLKIIPDHWYAWESRLEPFWEQVDRMAASILFHTGILYAFDDGSRFCRPVYLEKLLHYPDIRFAMAHIAWPWCEECLAVMGRMRAGVAGTQNSWQSYVDLTPGTPRHIRRQAVASALDFCGPERLLFGSDATVPGDLSRSADQARRDHDLLVQLELTREETRHVLSGNADLLFPARR